MARGQRALQITQPGPLTPFQAMEQQAVNWVLTDWTFRGANLLSSGTELALLQGINTGYLRIDGVIRCQTWQNGSGSRLVIGGGGTLTIGDFLHG